MSRKSTRRAAADDTPELTAADFARARPAVKAMPEVVAAMKRARGRPKLARPKEHVTLRLDPVVVDAFRQDGPGWQARINEALRKLVSHRSRAKRARRKAA